METTEVSLHQVKVYQAIRTSSKWMSVKEIVAASGICRRTADVHAKKLAKLGLVEVAAVFPGYRYRWIASAEKRNREHIARLDAAKEVFGLI